MPPERTWDVLLIGGASGVGKSGISYPLARRYGVPVLEVDDLVEAIVAVTTPDTHPDLHYWRTHPGAAAFPVERLVELQVTFARALEPAVAAVIGNHLDTDMPVVIEGDYLLPESASQNAFAGVPAKNRVRAVFLHDADVEVVAANYLAREPEAARHRERAEASVAYGTWLAAEAERNGIPVIAPRPWRSALDRVTARLEDT